MNYQVIYKDKLKNISVRVDYKGKVIVSAPKGTELYLIEFFLKKHHRWINKRLSAAKKFRSYNFSNGERFPLFDDCFILMLDKEFMTYECPYRLVVEDRDKEYKKGRVIKFYKKNLFSYISERIEYFSRIYNFDYQSINITSAKKRYGSCSSDKRLFFTWRLAMAPRFVVDYVIVHELAHTREMNHSKHFWYIVRNVMPTYQKAVRWLKENGSLLYID